MKIVLLLLSSAMLAVLCYAAFRENVTEFYDYIDSIEKPFNEDKFFKRFEQEAQEINLYSKNKEDKKALKKLLKKHDIYTNVYIYDDAEDNFLGGDFGKVLDEPVGITPLYSLQNDFEQYSFNRLISGSVKFKDGEGIVYVSSMHLLNMSQGDLSHAMTIMSHDELAILAQEMDTLRITLASNYQNEARIKEAHQEMITCLSHDLRTPLTALRGYLDILCLHCYKDEKQMDHYLNSCIEKTEQIKDLSNKTFEYSLVYNDDLIPSLETISSESFIQYIEEHLEYLELEGFKIEKEITISSVQLQLDLSMMKRMMDNICSNIQKYARKEQPIYLQISIEKGNLKIVFENEKKEINHEVESNKIGLKSVNKIIEIHQGQCFIQDLMDSFILIITFPCHL